MTNDALVEEINVTHRQSYDFDLPDSPLEIATVLVVGRATIKGVSLLESEVERLYLIFRLLGTQG